jgi:hypothetical protein
MPDTATGAPRAIPDLPSSAPTLEARVLDQLFHSARTQNKWQTGRCRTQRCKNSTTC